MKFSLPLCISVLVVLLSSNSVAQTEEKSKLLVDQKWHLEIYEIAGQKFPASDAEKDDYTIFYADHQAKSVSRGLTILFKWKYDAAMDKLLLYSDSTEETSENKILNLSEHELVLETTTPEEMTITIHMSNMTGK